MRFVFCILAVCAFAQDRPLPRYEVKRTAARISVDGRLDEAVWKGAAAVEFVFPWADQTGAKQKTTARLLWDASYLYVGYACDDLDVVAHFDKRDDPTSNEHAHNGLGCGFGMGRVPG